MLNISKNGIALAVLVIEALLTSLGIEFEAGTLEKGIEGTVVMIALILAIWNQLDRPDVKAFILKH